MQNIRKGRRVFWLVFSSLVLLAIACRVEAPRVIMEEATPTPEVRVMTQVVTQIITPTPPLVPPKTATPSPSPGPSPSPTWDPLAVPIYYPLEGCVASRLHVGDKVFVTLVGGPNAIRYGLDLQYDTIAIYAQPGDTLEIIGGPWCSHGWIVWFVRTLTGFMGYTPEGNGEEYWLLPLPPGT